MKTPIKMLLWDVERKELINIIIEKNSKGYLLLNQLHHFLNCETITMVSKRISGEYYDIICDDEALLKSDYILSLFNNVEPELAGNLIFTKSDKNGENIGLTTREESFLQNKLLIIPYFMRDKSFIGLRYDNTTKSQYRAHV